MCLKIPTHGTAIFKPFSLNYRTNGEKHMQNKPKRANGNGSISYNASRGTYRAFVTLPNKQHSRVSKSFKTKREASEWIAITRAEILKGDYIYSNDATTGEWLIEYIKTYKANFVALSSLERYFTTLKHLAPISHIPLHNLTPYDVQHLYAVSSQSLSYSSVIKMHRLLKAAIKKASALGIMKNMMDVVEAPRAPQQDEVQILTIDQIRTLFAYLAQSKYYAKYTPLIKCALYTGMRLGELLSLQSANVGHGVIKVSQSARYTRGKGMTLGPTKGKRIRNITISDDLANLLHDIAGACVYVFHNAHGEMLITRNVERTWKAVLKGAGLPDVRFHSLRHTHATQLLANGVPIMEVSKRLGHAQPSTTLNKYGHVLKGYERTIPNKVQAIFDV